MSDRRTPERVGGQRRTIAVLLLDPPLRGVESDRWCPYAPGSCRPPYDLQPSSLTGPPQPLGLPQEAALVLSGSILEHLRADRLGIAARHADRLAALLDFG